MVKKYILAGAVAAFLASANIVEAPMRNISRPSPIERAVIAKEAFGKKAEENEKKLDELVKEMKLTHNDEIYNTIFMAFLHLKDLDIPKYLTKRLMRKIVSIESWDYPNAVGAAGERGYTQMTKEAWYAVENDSFEKNAFNPERNIKASIKYFMLIDNFCRVNYPNWEKLSDKEKVRMLVASYNGGGARLMWEKWDISKMEPVTKAYIRRINKNMDWILPGI